MRFVTPQKLSRSLVITKGHYVNAKGRRTHHARIRETPTHFTAIDGEGMEIDGEHRYVLFGVGQDQISDANGLSYQRIFPFLYEHYKRGTAYVGFYLGYDFTQIFKTLPEDRARILLTRNGRTLRTHRIKGKAPHPVNVGEWQIDILGNKRLRLRPKECTCLIASCTCAKRPWQYICDAGPFFQTSFLNVVNPGNWPAGEEVVSPEEWETLVTGKAARATAVLSEEMKTYNRLENAVLERVMGRLDSGLMDIGIHLPPSKWFGPGQAAQQWLGNINAPSGADVQEKVPQWFLEAARESYFGGWFEIFMHGIIPGPTYEYDINSAYPSIIAKLPCLLHGKWTRGDGIPPKKGYSLVYARVWSPDRNKHIGAMLHRDSHGRILRPMATEGWYWWSELQAAYRAGLVKKLDNRGHQQITGWVNYEPCDCPPPMRDIAALYLQRLKWGKKTPRGKSAKLVYNADYGKFAQSIGDPIYGNPIYASLITSGCRTQILEAIATHPNGINHVCMVATDAVYFLTPHRGLNRSEALGQWDYQERTNLTLFKPGVYWDDNAREAISEGRSIAFKARGINAADFASQLVRIDREFESWRETGGLRGDPGRVWPSVTFQPSFLMISALQALMRNRWDLAGSVMHGQELTQNADPSDKRTGLYLDKVDGREIFRSQPYPGIRWEDGKPVWTRSQPYTKRFGMEDPWSEEYRTQFGEHPDGNPIDMLAWILKGE